MPNDRLPQLYAEVAAMTLEKCGQCMIPYHCCSPDYCEFAIDWAKEKWGVELQPTGHEKLPLLGENGCIAAPHLRPMCAVHVCESWYMQDRQFAKEYFRLREEIDRIEMENL